MPSIAHTTSGSSFAVVDPIGTFGDNAAMHEETQVSASDTMPTDGNKTVEKKPWVTPAATAKSVAEVTKTGVAIGKDATCHS
jgi:hypothetical protein